MRGYKKSMYWYIRIYEILDLKRSEIDIPFLKELNNIKYTIKNGFRYFY